MRQVGELRLRIPSEFARSPNAVADTGAWFLVGHVTHRTAA